MKSDSMPVTIRSSHPFGSKDLSQSLLIQFIFMELFSICKQLQAFNALIPSLLSLKTVKDVPHHHLSDITARLTMLAGSSHGYQSSFSWNNDWGSLNKLKHYFILFARGEKRINESLLPWQSEVHRTLLAVFHCLDFLYFVEEEEREDVISQYTTFTQNLMQINTNLLKLARAITPLIAQFKSDENLIFFLLRHQENLSELYGKEFLVNLLSSLFPNGLSEMEKFLHDKYSARAFDYLIPIISEKLSLLVPTHG